MTCLVISKSHNQIAIDSRVTWNNEIRSDTYDKWVQCPKQEQFFFVLGEMGIVGNLSDAWQAADYKRNHIKKILIEVLAKDNYVVYYDRKSGALFEFYLKDDKLMQLEIVDDLYCMGSGRRVAQGAMLADQNLTPLGAVKIASKVILDVGGNIFHIPLQLEIEES